MEIHLYASMQWESCALAIVPEEISEDRFH